MASKISASHNLSLIEKTIFSRGITYGKLARGDYCLPQPHPSDDHMPKRIEIDRCVRQPQFRMPQLSKICVALLRASRASG